MAYIIGQYLFLGEGLKNLVKDAVTVLNGKEYTYNIYIVHGSGEEVDNLYYEYKGILFVCGERLDIHVQWVSNPYYIDKEHFIESRDADSFVRDIIRFVICPKEEGIEQEQNKNNQPWKTTSRP